MARFSLFCLLFVCVALWGAEHPSDTADTNNTATIQNSSDTNETKDQNTLKSANAPVVIEDRSGLTQEELGKKAKEFDKEKKHLKIKDVVESIDENGKVDVTKLVKEKSSVSIASSSKIS